jgi:Mg-chelatase subunit ChlI
MAKKLPFKLPVRLEVNGDKAPIVLCAADMELIAELHGATRAEAEAIRDAINVLPKLRRALLNASGALDAVSHEVGQMEGLFDDKDGNTAAAKEAAQQSQAEVDRVLSQSIMRNIREQEARKGNHI